MAQFALRRHGLRGAGFLSEAARHRRPEIFVAEFRVTLRERRCHGARGGQQVPGTHLVVAVEVVEPLYLPETGKRGVHRFRRDPPVRGAGRSGDLGPQLVPQSLDEIGIAVAHFHQPRQRRRRDPHALRAKRLRERGGGRLRVQPPDAPPLAAIPERSAQGVQSRREVGCPGEHQQERQPSPHLLAGVQHEPTEIRIQPVRLIEQHHEGFPGHAPGQGGLELGRLPLLCRPSEPPRRKPLRQQFAPEGLPHDRLGEAGPVPVRRRGQPNHLHSGLLFDPLLQPEEERRLAVSPRPVEHDFRRRRHTPFQEVDDRAESRLLRLPTREEGRVPAGARSKRPDRRGRSHGAGTDGPVRNSTVTSPGRLGSAPPPRRRRRPRPDSRRAGPFEVESRSGPPRTGSEGAGLHGAKRPTPGPRPPRRNPIPWPSGRMGAV